MPCTLHIPCHATLAPNSLAGAPYWPGTWDLVGRPNTHTFLTFLIAGATLTSMTYWVARRKSKLERGVCRSCSAKRDGGSSSCLKCKVRERARDKERRPGRKRSRQQGERKRPGGPRCRFRASLRHKYQLSWEEYSKMVLLSLGECVICQEKADLVVDHCHQTGIVRGLLCQPCNVMLGFSKDRPEVLRAGAVYLLGGELSLQAYRV